jgi:hypothetical protein
MESGRIQLKIRSPNTAVLINTMPTTSSVWLLPEGASTSKPSTTNARFTVISKRSQCRWCPAVRGCARVPFRGQRTYINVELQCLAHPNLPAVVTFAAQVLEMHKRFSARWLC